MVVHQNIQGLSGKELEIELFLKKHNVQIFCVTEHWLQSHQLVFSNEYYSVKSAFVRKKAIHGGSMIFVCNYLMCKERKDIASLSIEHTVELSCVELEQHIITCVYRPPSSDFILFENTMEDVLKRLSNSNKQVVVCGDFNINLLEHCTNSTRLISLFQSFNLNYLFSEPTRITSHSATCLDNIFCNCTCIDKVVTSDLTSDHCGQKAVFGLNKTNKVYNVMCRPITNYRLARFKSNVSCRVTHMDLAQENPSDFYKSLFSIIEVEYRNTFKTKTLQRNKTNMRFCDWATVGIYKSRTRMYELYGMKQSNFDPNFIQYVRNYSNVFKKVCAAAKVLCLSRKIKLAENRVKATWNIINNETGRTLTRDTHFELKVGDSSSISDNKIVAETFNNHFASIPISTTSSLNSCPVKAASLVTGCVKKCGILFSFKYINPNDVVKVFKSLNSKKTGDLWGLSVKILDSIIYNISPYLAAIFNRCVDKGEFPNLMKHSKILPLFKSGCKSDPNNFRPISILPAISKIFEKLILQQLECHFSSNNLFHNEQYGFTKGRSTIDAGVTLMKHIFNAWENSQDAIGVFCDLSKAFDCVEHRTLLQKLRHYGIKGTALELISSYLSYMIQHVDINGIRSTGLDVTLGVPQGSILGPFLFLVYINDLPFYIQNFCNIVLFADDTSLIFKVDRKKTNFDDVNGYLAKVLDWFTTNNLMLNSNKTKCVRFSLPNVRKSSLNITLNNEVINLVDTTVFLGITLDSKLQWGDHIRCLAGKLSSAAYAVRKVRQFTDVDTARLVYFSYFHSVMSYGILLWGRAADIQTIFVIQKRAVRAIYNLGARVSLRERFKEIDILTVASQYIFANIMLVRKNISSYRRNCDLHNLNTRNSYKLVGPYHRLHKVHNSFAGLSVRFYNKIPTDILNLPLCKFKLSVKNYLTKRAYYTINEFLNDKWD